MMSQTESDEAKKIWDELDADEHGTPPSQVEQVQQGEMDAEVDTSAAAEDAPLEEEARTPDQQYLDKISGLEALLTQTNERLRRAESRIGNLNTEINRQRETAKELLARGVEAPSDKELKAAQQDPEEMVRLREDYPEFAEAMNAALEARLKQHIEASKPAPVDEVPVPENVFSPPESVTQDDIERIRNDIRVEIKHPGWHEKVKTPQFVGWLNRQNREVVMLAQSDDSHDAIRLLDLYDESIAKAKPNARLNSAAGLSTKRSGTGNTRQVAVDEMTPEEFWRYLDEQERTSTKR